VIASNVAPGAASGYSVVAASTALQLDVLSANSLATVWSSSSLSAPLSVPGNSVFTLFMLGDAAAPVALLRRDR